MLTPDKARRAIYMDFEGLISEDGEDVPPTLLGYEVEKAFTCWIHDERLRLLALGVRSCRNEIMSLESAVGALIRRCEEEERHLVSFSQHEQAVVHRWMPEVAGAFDAVWINAKLFIHRWAKTRPNRFKAIIQHPETGGRTLENNCRLAGLKPSEAPTGGPASAIRFLLDKMGRVNRWRALDETVKERVRHLVAYNREDCARLRRLTVKAANALS